MLNTLNELLSASSGCCLTTAPATCQHCFLNNTVQPGIKPGLLRSSMPGSGMQKGLKAKDLNDPGF